MNTSTIRILLALFMIAHGLVHLSLTLVPAPQPGGMHTPFWPGWWRTDTDPAWLASRMGLSTNAVRTAGWLLWMAALVAFVLAGLGRLGLPGLAALWAPLAAAGSLASLILLAFYWHPWFIAAAGINLILLAGIWMHWPASVFTK
ncbi:MAG: hypothetical protein EHM21_15815 [Chloroflexi bacterium]|nr:MAG: hypothetical protein EHM21_15815 [Chloroflexota bacterium]